MTSVERTVNGDCDPEFFARFDQLLREMVPRHCAARGIDFEGLPDIEKERLSNDLLQRFARSEWRAYSLRCQQVSLEFRPHDQVDINLRKVEIGIVGREELVTLVPSTERMLAYFIALAEAKIWRGQDPLIASDQLARTVDKYSVGQLRDHLLDPLAESGILLVDPSKRGYRLSVDPEVLWEILQGTDFSYDGIEAEGCESWLRKRYPGAVLVGSHQEKMLKAILFQARVALSDDDLFDLERIRMQTGLGQDWMYKSLHQLEELGIICRPRVGDQYRMADIVDKNFLAEIVRRQETPIVIRVNPPDSYTARLAVDRQEKFSFPEVSWEGGEGFEGLPQERKLRLLEKVLTARGLRPNVYEAARKSYSVRIPEIDDVPRELVFGTLQYLGIGPRELANLSPSVTETLAIAIRRLEEKIKSKQSLPLNYELLMEQIKVRILSLVFEEKIFGGDSHNWTFVKVMEYLPDSSLLDKEAA